jgi:hypothetical protein
MPMLKPKAQTPTVIDSNAPFACKITRQRFQTVGRRHAQVIHFDRLFNDSTAPKPSPAA